MFPHLLVHDMLLKLFVTYFFCSCRRFACYLFSAATKKCLRSFSLEMVPTRKMGVVSGVGTFSVGYRGCMTARHCTVYLWKKNFLFPFIWLCTVMVREIDDRLYMFLFNTRLTRGYAPRWLDYQTIIFQVLRCKWCCTTVELRVTKQLHLT